MLFFPYRAQIKLHKVPVVTIAVAILCLAIYFAQERNRQALVAHADSVCAALPEEGEGVTSEGYDVGRSYVSCEHAVLGLYDDPNPERLLAEIIAYMEAAGSAQDARRLEGQYRAFAERAPTNLTAGLSQDLSRFDPLGMLTSSFAHADWEHVIFNLIFFFAFAAAVELILGQVLFVVAFVAISFGIGIFDQVVSQWEGFAGSTLGLSGVVMGMLALFIYFLPRARIRFFVWFMLSVGTIGIPAWLVGTWYIGLDLYNQLARTQSYVNFGAHLAGAGFGLLIGTLVFSGKRRWARDIVEEQVDLTQDEPWISKINGVLMGPVVAGLAIVVWLILITGVIALVQHHWVLLLALAPALGAGFLLYRSRQAERPRRGRYELGLKALEARDYDQAMRHLGPLAEKNDTRALFALAKLYASAWGAMTNEAKAVELYTRAAERGHAQAKYQLARMYADGRGVAPSMVKALEYYEQAALAGLPDAANTLGYHHENGIGVPEDREQAIEWYYRAGVGYQKAQRRDDARAVIRHLAGLASSYPTVLALTHKLKGVV